MKKLLTLTAFAAVALTGCNTPNHIEGNLVVAQNLNVNALTAVFNQKKAISLPAGSYATSLYMQASGAEVRVQTKGGVYHFEVPQIKADALGTFNVSAAQLGQEFSFQGKLFDTREDIDRVVSDSCIHHYENQYVCKDVQVCDDKGQNCQTQQQCDWEQVPVYGTEPVREQGYQDTKNVEVGLLEASAAVGKFEGSYTYSEDIQSRDVVGDCTL